MIDGRCVQCAEEEAEAKRKARYDATIKRLAPKAREYLNTEFESCTEAVRAYWRAMKAEARKATGRSYDIAYLKAYRAKGLDADQAFISATPAHLKFGMYARLLDHAVIKNASGERRLSLDHIFPRNRLEGIPPALGLHIPENLQCISTTGNRSKRNNISGTEHREGLTAGRGALLDEFATLPRDDRMIYYGPRPPYIPDGERRPYPAIDKCSLINVELPADADEEDAEAFIDWLAHQVGVGGAFMDIPCDKMDAFQPEPGSFDRAPSGSCAIIYDDEPVDAMIALNFASLIQPDKGTVIFAHPGYDADMKRIFPITLDGDGLTMSAYAAKALDDIAAFYARYGLETE